MADKDQDPARVFAFSVRFEYVMEKERLGLRERERERERERADKIYKSSERDENQVGVGEVKYI
jgi:hypothetical protein